MLSLPQSSPILKSKALEAARVLLRRREIRGSLTEWCRHRGFEPAAHHRLIIEKLEAVERGDIRRLALFLPPGSAKSTYASVLFPPWFLARNPKASVIAASHTAQLAEGWGRKVRNVVAEETLTLGVGVAPDSAAAGRWETTLGGEYFAAGVGGSITGRRADLVIIDDPVRAREDADSEVIRDRTWEWYRSDLLTRLRPNARIVLIQTRWHEDDLAGRVIADMASGGQKWDIVRIPFVAEDDDPLGRKPGERLWATYYTDEIEHEARRDARTWTALYQQRPAPESGDFFKKEWLRYYTDPPPLDTLAVYMGSDYAVTSKGGDYTVHAVVGIDPAGRMFLLDLWRAQSDSATWVNAWCDLVLKWKPIAAAEEQGQIKAGVGPFLDRRARDRRAYCGREQFPTRGDKASRAQSIRGRMALDGIYIPADAPWRADLEAELMSFPAGVHDDQVDALGLVGQLLDIMRDGRKPASKPNLGPMPGYSVPTYNGGRSTITL